MSNKLSIGNPSAAAKLAAIRAAAAKPDALAKTQPPAVKPEDAKERLRLIGDDSGSMMSHEKDVRDGIIEFFRNCIPGETSAAVHLLCTKDENNKLSVLNSNLIELASWMQVVRFGWGGTPLFSALKRALEAEPRATRLIAFTDGSPTDHLAERSWGTESTALTIPFSTYKDAVLIVAQAQELKIPIDTVFFGEGVWRDWESGKDVESDEVKLLKYLAEQTGGYFLKFDPKKTSFRQGLKYLAPVNRLALASESFRKEVEEGKRS